MAPRRGGGARLPLAAALLPLLLLLALAPRRARGQLPPGGRGAANATEGPPAINNTAIHGLFHALHGVTEPREHPELGWREFREVLEAWHAAAAPASAAPTFARQFHVNRYLHLLRGPGGLQAFDRVSFPAFSAAVNRLAERAGVTAPGEAPGGQEPPAGEEAGCADLPDAIRRRRGSCRLKRLRHALEQGRGTSGLFDSRRWAADFEAGLIMMWELHAAGEKPMHIVVNSEAAI